MFIISTSPEMMENDMMQPNTYTFTYTFQTQTTKNLNMYVLFAAGALLFDKLTTGI